MEKKLRFLLLLTLTFLIFLLPLVTFPFFQFPFDFTPYILILAFGTILLLLLSALVATQGRLVIPERSIGLPLVGLILTYIVSTAFSISPTASFFGIYGFYAGSLIVLLFLTIVYLSVLNLPNDKDLILKSLILAGVAVSLFGITEYIGHLAGTGEIVYRIRAPLGQPNRLAFFLLPLIPLSFWAWTKAKEKSEKVIFGISSLLMLIALFLTFTRTAYIVLLALGSIAYFLTPLKQKISKFAPPLVILFVVFGIILLRSVPYILENFEKSSPGLRLAELQSTWGVVANRPFIKHLIGHGPETTYLTFFKYRSAIHNQIPEERRGGPPAIRNQYLQLLGTAGVIGVLFYLFFVLRLLHQAYLRKSYGVFLSLLAVFLFSLFYFQTFQVLLMLFILLGLESKKESFMFKKDAAKAVFLFLGTVLALFTGYYTLQATRAEYLASTSVTIDELREAVRLNPWTDTYKRELSYALSQKLRTEKDKKTAISLYKEAKQLGEEALKTVPRQIDSVRVISSMSYWAGVHIDKRFHHDSLRYAKEYVRLSPSDYEAHDALGLVYLDTGRLDEAEKAFQKEKEVFPNHPLAYLHLGEVAKQKGEVEKAINYYRQAVRLAPDYEFARQELKKAEKLR